MDRDGMFELRVLTGLHSGARALLSGDAQTLGSSPDCDLVVTDDGVLAEHARLEHQNDGSTLLRWLDGDLPPLVIRPGQGASIGPVLVAVDTTDSPWNENVPLSEEAASSRDPAFEFGAGGGRLPNGCGVGTDFTASKQARWARALKRPLVIASALVAVLSIASLWLGLHRPEQAHVTQMPPPAVPAPRPDTQVRLRAAVAGLELGERVRIMPAPMGGQGWVEASFLTAEESETLAYALSRLSLRPKLSVLTAADLVAKADAIASGHADGRKLTVRHAGGRSMSIEGRVPTASDRDRLLAALTAGLPQVGSFDPSAIVTDAQAADAMVKQIQAGGLRAVHGQWQDDVLLLEVRLAASEVPLWERLLLAAATRHEIRFRATVQFVAMPAQPLVRLPFSVRSVVSAELPYLVLSDGRKLLMGAKVEGWQLSEIRPSAIVFEGADGRRITLER